MTDWFDIAHTPSVLRLQDDKKSRGLYTDVEGGGEVRSHTLSAEEVEFITSRDSFYLASVSETGWPYVQHRGGEGGFIHVIGDHTIGWLERSGNRQYVGTGNMTADERVAAIFMDYPSRRRIKLYGRATHHPVASPELVAALGGDAVRNDGAVTIDVAATAWNCPKYITPRYTEAQVDSVIGGLTKRIERLEADLAEARGTSADG